MPHICIHKHQSPRDCPSCLRLEIERLRELCGNAARILAEPPQVKIEGYRVSELCERLREAAEAGGVMKGTLTGRCDSCRELHAPGAMCPPHEVRTTGFTWFRLYIEELETKVEQLQRKNERLSARRVRSEIERLQRENETLQSIVDDLAKAHASGGFIELDADLAEQLAAEAKEK